MVGKGVCRNHLCLGWNVFILDLMMKLIQDERQFGWLSVLGTDKEGIQECQPSSVKLCALSNGGN